MFRNKMLRTVSAVFAPEAPSGDVQPLDKQTSDKNNNKDTVDPMNGLWDDEEVKEPEVEKVDPAVQARNAQDYFNTLNLLEGIDEEKFSEALQKGDAKSILATFKTVGLNAYKQGLKDSIKANERKIKDAVDIAVSRSTAVGSATKTVELMNKELPFTKEKGHKDVANAVLARALQKGMAPEKAVQSVKAFFQDATTKAARDLGLNLSTRTVDDERDEATKNIQWDEFFGAVKGN